MLKNLLEAKNLCKKYEIPVEDIILIALNCDGVNSDKNYKRIRFKLKLNSFLEEFYMALPIIKTKSPFYLSSKDSKLFFNNEDIGAITEEELDTCDSTYFRRSKTELTLNSNSRSLCKGCKFCGTYVQGANDSNDLTTKEMLRVKLEEIIEENKMNNLSNIFEVAVCTGCFPNKNETLNHLIMIREVLEEYNFKGELKYIGSQITSEKSLDILSKKASPFYLALTVECFTRREKLMKSIKSKVTLAKAKNILKKALERGFETSILYIIGLDPLETAVSGLKMFLPFLSRFPIINIFQNYKPEHEFLRDPLAKKIDYYLQARKEIEKLYLSTDLRPRAWENYRSLWYLTFGGEEIHDIRI